MKKLLYTLLVGLIVISCNKDGIEDGADFSSISPIIEATVEKFDSSLIDATIERLISSSRKRPTKNTLTNKDNPIGSSIKINTVTTGGAYYEFVFTDDIASCDADGFVFETLFLVLANNGTSNTLEVRLSTPTGLLLLTIERDLAFLFTLSFSEALKVEGSTVSFVDGALGTSFLLDGSTYNFSCDTAGVWSDDGTGLWSNPDFGSYRLAPAPFPLVGRLATVVTEAEGIDGTLNYAASNVAAVRSAIEGSFDN